MVFRGRKFGRRGRTSRLDRCEPAHRVCQQHDIRRETTVSARFASRAVATMTAGALFGAVTALCVVTGGNHIGNFSLLYVLPIAAFGLSGGLRGGLAGAGAGLGSLGAWAFVEHGDVHVLGFLTRASVFLVVGVLSGMLRDQRSRTGATDRRWFSMSNDMLVEASLDGYFTRLSEQWEQCLGWTRQELMARPFRELVHPDDLAATNVYADSLDRRPGEVSNFENRYLAKDGSWRWLLWSARSDNHRKYAVARDISDRKRLEQERDALLQQVEMTARTDSLTGLPNRRFWDEEVRRAIAQAQRHGRPLAVAMVDLDGFKQFNDAHGHVVGDTLLSDAAARWRMVLRTADFLARYGGEEFAILLPDCKPFEAEGLLDRLRTAMPMSQTCSVGVAYWSVGEGPDDLVAKADAALYEAKRRGRNQVMFAAPGPLD